MCTKCKPKLVVNPMPLSLPAQQMASTQASLASPIPITVSQTYSPSPSTSITEHPSEINTQKASILSTSRVKTAKVKLNSSELSDTPPPLPPQPPPATSTQFEALKTQYDKLAKENAEISSKFKVNQKFDERILKIPSLSYLLLIF